jgi:hypothetical protein
VLKLGDLAAGADGEVALPVTAATPSPPSPPPSTPPMPRPGWSGPMGGGIPLGPGGPGRELYTRLQSGSELFGTSAGLSQDEVRVREALLKACFQEGASVLSPDEALLLAWVGQDPLGATVGGERPRDVGQTLLIVHLPLAARRSS